MKKMNIKNVFKQYSEFIEFIISSNSIYRWNELPKSINFTLLDREAFKTMITFFLIKELKLKKTKKINFDRLIGLHILNLLLRTNITDIKNTLLNYLKKNNIKIFHHFLNKLKNNIFIKNNKTLLNLIKNYSKIEQTLEGEIYKLSSFIATEYELKYIYTNNYESQKILSSVENKRRELIKNSIIYRNYFLNENLKKFFDLLYNLTFQKRGTRLPLIERYSVMGHSMLVLVFNYFFIIDQNDKNKIKKYYISLFHDFSESFTRDIITPIKEEIEGLEDILYKYEKEIFEKEIKFLIKNSYNELKEYVFDPFKNYPELKFGDLLSAYIEIKNLHYYNEELKNMKKRISKKEFFIKQI